MEKRIKQRDQRTSTQRIITLKTLTIIKSKERVTKEEVLIDSETAAGIDIETEVGIEGVMKGEVVIEEAEIEGVVIEAMIDTLIVAGIEAMIDIEIAAGIDLETETGIEEVMKEEEAEIEAMIDTEIVAGIEEAEIETMIDLETVAGID